MRDHGPLGRRVKAWRVTLVVDSSGLALFAREVHDHYSAEARKCFSTRGFGQGV